MGQSVTDPTYPMMHTELIHSKQMTNLLALHIFNILFGTWGYLFIGTPNKQQTYLHSNKLIGTPHIQHIFWHSGIPLDYSHSR